MAAIRPDNLGCIQPLLACSAVAFFFLLKYCFPKNESTTRTFKTFYCNHYISKISLLNNVSRSDEKKSTGLGANLGLCDRQEDRHFKLAWPSSMAARVVQAREPAGTNGSRAETLTGCWVWLLTSAGNQQTSKQEEVHSTVVQQEPILGQERASGASRVEEIQESPFLSCGRRRANNVKFQEQPAMSIRHKLQ
jgi:hypothetical protein